MLFKFERALIGAQKAKKSCIGSILAKIKQTLSSLWRFLIRTSGNYRWIITVAVVQTMAVGGSEQIDECSEGRMITVTL